MVNIAQILALAPRRPVPSVPVGIWIARRGVQGADKVMPGSPQTGVSLCNGAVEQRSHYPTNKERCGGAANMPKARKMKLARKPKLMEFIERAIAELVGKDMVGSSTRSRRHLSPSDPPRLRTRT